MSNLSSILNLIGKIQSLGQPTVDEVISEPLTPAQEMPPQTVSDLFKRGEVSAQQPVPPVVPKLSPMFFPRLNQIRPTKKQIQTKQVKVPQTARQKTTNLTIGSIHPLIQKYFPRSQWANAQRVMFGESGGNPQAIGDKYPIRGLLAPSYGLFQIRGLSGRPGAQQLLDPDFNVKYAANLFNQQGWNPWSFARKIGLPGTQPL